MNETLWRLRQRLNSKIKSVSATRSARLVQTWCQFPIMYVLHTNCSPITNTHPLRPPPSTSRTRSGVQVQWTCTSGVWVRALLVFPLCLPHGQPSPETDIHSINVSQDYCPIYSVCVYKVCILTFIILPGIMTKQPNNTLKNAQKLSMYMIYTRVDTLIVFQTPLTPYG